MAATPDPPSMLVHDRGASLDTSAETQHIFRKIVESLPDAILVHSNDIIVFVNPCCVRLLAAGGSEQLLGKCTSGFVDPRYLPAIRNRVRDCYSTGMASPPMESTLIACDGSSVEVEAIAIPISWNGSPAIEVVLRDIGKRKQAERAVEEWQKRLELSLKAGLRIGLWDWDVVANTVAWSDETYRQFGHTRDTFSGRVEDFVARIHPEDRPRVQDAIQTVLAGGTEYTSQFRLLLPDGSTPLIDAHGVMIRDERPHMVGVGIDITDVKRAEQSLQESKEKYLLLLNSTAEAIYGVDLDGSCTFCNPACARLLGYPTPEDLIGRNMHTILHYLRADGTPNPEQDCKLYAAVREGRAVHFADELLWRADRTSFSGEYWSYPVYKFGKLAGSVVTIIDISERKRTELALRKSEEKYRELFENAVYGIFRSKPDGTLLDVNPALVNMLGYGSRDELLAKKMERDIYDDPAARRAIIDKCRFSGRAVGAEVNWKRRDGTLIAVRLSGGAIQEGTGQSSHFEVIVEDITKQRILEEEFRQAQKMEAVGLLAGGVSHDFNNLLSVILGNAELLLETTQSGAQRHHAEEIQKATRGAAHLTRQLLAFSRKQVLYPRTLDLNTIIRDVAEILPRMIGEDVQIATDLAKRLGSIRADRGQIEQVLLNLVTNARDAMPNGGKLSIRTENVEISAAEASRHAGAKSGRYVCLSLTDTGVGMSRDVQSRAFEPFFTTKPPGRGTGLGLAATYAIVAQNGGYVSVASAPGAGATFQVFLPRLEEPSIEFIPDLEVRDVDPRGTETILLLEDEESLRQVFCEILRGGGYNVLQARRGDHALDLAGQYKGLIPLMISDVVLPDMNGPSVVAALQALHPETKALYVSGYADVPVVQQLLADGAAFMQKPITRKDLLRNVDQMLHPGALFTS